MALRAVFADGWYRVGDGACFFVHHFVWPVQVVGDIEHRFTWHENVNSVAVHGFDGSELYTLSGHCYVKDRGKMDDGRPHPGLAVVACYDGGIPFRYLVREGMSFTMENTGGSYGWEKPRATIRMAGSQVSYGLSDYAGRCVSAKRGNSVKLNRPTIGGSLLNIGSR